MKKTRKQYTAQEKVAILRRHLLDHEPISKICDDVGLQPTVLYRWQKEFFENGAAVFQTKVRSNHQPEQERLEYLTKKIPDQGRGSGGADGGACGFKKSLGEL